MSSPSSIFDVLKQFANESRNPEKKHVIFVSNPMTANKLELQISVNATLNDILDALYKQHNIESEKLQTYQLMYNYKKLTHTGESLNLPEGATIQLMPQLQTGHSINKGHLSTGITIILVNTLNNINTKINVPIHASVKHLQNALIKQYNSLPERVNNVAFVYKNKHLCINCKNLNLPNNAIIYMVPKLSLSYYLRTGKIPKPTTIKVIFNFMNSKCSLPMPVDATLGDFHYILINSGLKPVEEMIDIIDKNIVYYNYKMIKNCEEKFDFSNNNVVQLLEKKNICYYLRDKNISSLRPDYNEWKDIPKDIITSNKIILTDIDIDNKDIFGLLVIPGNTFSCRRVCLLGKETFTHCKQVYKSYYQKSLIKKKSTPTKPHLLGTHNPELPENTDDTPSTANKTQQLLELLRKQKKKRHASLKLTNQKK